MANGVESIRYLIVGGGVAGASAAMSIRNVDPSGEIALIGQEVVRPYHRPPLSKAFLRGEIGKAELSQQPIGWYPEHHIRLITGRRVSMINVARHRATLDDGTTIQFEQCVLAYGALPAPLEIPGAGMAGVYYLRSLTDAEHLRTRIARAIQENSRRVVVIGGGLLGAEVAASLQRLELEVDWVYEHALPWHPFAGEAAGRFVLDLHRHHGVTIHLANPASAIKGDGRVQRVELADGTALACDFAVACVGGSVDHRPVANTGVTIGRGLHVDRFGRTNVDRLWAAGDCCVMDDERFGKPLLAGHWDIARLQGSLVGTNMANTIVGGELLPWTQVPGWHSEMFGFDVFAWGAARFIDRRIVRGTVNVTSPAFAEVGIDADGKVCHVLTVGRDHEYPALRKLVEDRASADKTRLRDPMATLEP